MRFIHSSAMISFGLVLGAAKCEGPTRLMDWLGFQVDTAQMTVGLSSKRIKKIKGFVGIRCSWR